MNEDADALFKDVTSSFDHYIGLQDYTHMTAACE